MCTILATVGSAKAAVNGTRHWMRQRLFSSTIAHSAVASVRRCPKMRKKAKVHRFLHWRPCWRHWPGWWAVGKLALWVITLTASRHHCPGPMLRRILNVFNTPKTSCSFCQVLDIQPAEAPAFDRPSLNWSVHAWTINEEEEREEHVELGFLSLKPAREQNGFVPDGQEANDLVALEMASNTGRLFME